MLNCLVNAIYGKTHCTSFAHAFDILYNMRYLHSGGMKEPYTLSCLRVNLRI